jgi:hypothetical protein
MDKQFIEQKMQMVFKSLTPEIVYSIENNEEHCVQIISESFRNKSMNDRMGIVLSLVKSNLELSRLDEKFDFTYYPLTPNESKSRSTASFELEDGNQSSDGQAAKSL